jgi:1,4-alpha-glucan branching enzyme
MITKAKAATRPAKKSKPAKSSKKTTDSRTAAAKKTKTAIPSIEFKLVAPDAKEVYLVGEFNDWNASQYRLRRYKHGTYKKKLQLKPGSYQYLFLVDGEWWTDPEHLERKPNPFGSENSVITVS